MTNEKVIADIDRRSPRFHFDSKNFTERTISPDAIVWIGVDGGGDLNTLLPVLFNRSENGIQRFESFSDDTTESTGVEAPSYNDSPKSRDVIADLTYQIQEIPQNYVNSESPTQSDVRALAQQWKNKNAENSIEVNKNVHSETVRRLDISLTVYSKEFRTYIPFFTSFPEADTLRDVASGIRIPCVSVPSEGDSRSPAPKMFPTFVKTSVIQI
ncbi:hypothetical protein [Halobellus rarus]|uniref:Uncharacterized protein n=1 Tax=Halobellus rarus TaxID=1126237 RepID=A0ABD6CMM2_9EURY|nr:hypothetical protein [Halobellus rarus]